MITQGESPLLEVNSLRLDSREKDPALCRLANGWPEANIWRASIGHYVDYFVSISQTQLTIFGHPGSR